MGGYGHTNFSKWCVNQVLYQVWILGISRLNCDRVPLPSMQSVHWFYIFLSFSLQFFLQVLAQHGRLRYRLWVSTWWRWHSAATCWTLGVPLAGWPSPSQLSSVPDSEWGDEDGATDEQTENHVDRDYTWGDMAGRGCKTQEKVRVSAVGVIGQEVREGGRGRGDDGCKVSKAQFPSTLSYHSIPFSRPT